MLYSVYVRPRVQTSFPMDTFIVFKVSHPIFFGLSNSLSNKTRLPSSLNQARSLQREVSPQASTKSTAPELAKIIITSVIPTMASQEEEISRLSRLLKWVLRARWHRLTRNVPDPFQNLPSPSCWSVLEPSRPWWLHSHKATRQQFPRRGVSQSQS